jgi:hypothetical protein
VTSRRIISVPWRNRSPFLAKLVWLLVCWYLLGAAGPVVAQRTITGPGTFSFALPDSQAWSNGYSYKWTAGAGGTVTASVSPAYFCDNNVGTSPGYYSSGVLDTTAGPNVGNYSPFPGGYQFTAVPGHSYIISFNGSEGSVGSHCIDVLENAGPGTVTITTPMSRSIWAVALRRAPRSSRSLRD